MFLLIEIWQHVSTHACVFRVYVCGSDRLCNACKTHAHWHMTCIIHKTEIFNKLKVVCRQKVNSKSTVECCYAVHALVY